MASIYNFKDIEFKDGSATLAFDAAGQQLVFNDLTVLPTWLRVSAKGDDAVLEIVSGAHAGNSIVLDGAVPQQLWSGNVSFESGGKLLIGDDSLALDDDSGHTLIGTPFADAFVTFHGADTLSGRGGHDVFFVTVGDGYNGKSINGGAGSDTIVLQAAEGAVTGALVWYGLATIYWDVTATGFSLVENVTGTENNDRFFGDAGNNRFLGMGGIDNLTGGAGADFLDGGAGTDTANYGSSPAYYDGDPSGVIVSLAAGSATDGYGATDTLRNFE